LWLPLQHNAIRSRSREPKSPYMQDQVERRVEARSLDLVVGKWREKIDRYFRK
jgi:hypothetical protein